MWRRIRGEESQCALDRRKEARGNGIKLTKQHPPARQSVKYSFCPLLKVLICTAKRFETLEEDMAPS